MLIIKNSWKLFYLMAILKAINELEIRYRDAKVRNNDYGH
jgi:hypothetical protein